MREEYKILQIRFLKGTQDLFCDFCGSLIDVDVLSSYKSNEKRRTLLKKRPFDDISNLMKKKKKLFQKV